MPPRVITSGLSCADSALKWRYNFKAAPATVGGRTCQGESKLIDTTRRYLVPLVLFLLALMLFYQHRQILVAAVPLDLYEGTMLLSTGIYADGNNPYTFEFQPQAANVYPPLYNIIVAPLSKVFGNTFLLHRTVSAIFILAACVLAGLATTRQAKSWRAGLATAVMLYAALLFYGTPVASTNALGEFLFLAGLIIPWWKNFSVPSLLFAALCGLLAFFSKQYFILGIAMLCLYLFLYVSMARGVFLGLVFSLALIASLSVVHTTSPYYLDNTLFAPSAAMQGLQTWHILWLQLWNFVVIYAGLLLVLLIPALANWRLAGFQIPGPRNSEQWQLAGAGWSGPLLKKPHNFFWFCLLWASLAIVFVLGRNPGNYMTYLFQLMSPFLLIAGLSAAAVLPRRWWPILLLLLWSLYKSWAILHKDFTVEMDNWRKVESMIADSDQVLATQMLVSTFLKYDKPVHQDGHTFYFPLAVNKPRWFVKDREEERVESVWRNYITDLYRKIERGEFDMILVSPWEMRGIFMRNPPPFEDVSGKEFLKRHYRVDEKISLSMTDRHGAGTYNIMVWRPRSAPERLK